MTSNDQTMPLGTSQSFTLTITQADGVTPYNLTGATINFVAAFAPLPVPQVFLTTPSGLILFNKSAAGGAGAPPVQSPTPTNGQVTVWFVPADTSNMPGWYLLYCYVIVTDSSGSIYQIKKFTVRLTV